MVLNKSGIRAFIGWMMDHKICAKYGLTRNLSLEVFFNIIKLLSTLQLIYNRKMTKFYQRQHWISYYLVNYLLKFQYRYYTGITGIDIF
jgi:hypothetical protein